MPPRHREMLPPSLCLARYRWVMASLPAHRRDSVVAQAKYPWPRIAGHQHHCFRNDERVAVDLIHTVPHYRHEQRDHGHKEAHGVSRAVLSGVVHDRRWRPVRRPRQRYHQEIPDLVSHCPRQFNAADCRCRTHTSTRPPARMRCTRQIDRGGICEYLIQPDTQPDRVHLEFTDKKNTAHLNRAL